MSQELNLAEILETRLPAQGITIYEKLNDLALTTGAELRGRKACARSQISPKSGNRDYQHKAFTISKKVSAQALTPGHERREPGAKS